MDFPKKIMLVDDDLDDQFLFSHAMKEVDASMNCLCVDNAEQAMEKLEEPENPDYIFLDLNLPMTDGLSFLKQLKEHQQFQNIPIIIYSTSSRKQDMEKAKALGAEDYIQKPSTFDELKRMIQKVFTVLL